MKAVRIHELGPPEVMKYEDVADPVPGDDDVLIDVEMSTIEGGDHIYRTMVPLAGGPRTLGFQAIGTVVGLGKNVTSFKLGQRVVGFNLLTGGYAEKFVTPANTTYAIPDSLDSRLAVTIPATFATADETLFEFGKLQPGETVFINGGAGGVGLAAIQLAKAAGATVYATARTSARAKRLEDFGAHHGIAYDEMDYAEAILRLTHGKGVDLVVDLVGGDASATAKLLSTLRNRGRLGVIGAASGHPQSVGFWDLILKSLTVYGLAVDMTAPRVRDAILQHLASAAQGKLKMPIERAYPLSQAAEAHRYGEENRPFGRMVLVR